MPPTIPFPTTTELNAADALSNFYNLSPTQMDALTASEPFKGAKATIMEKHSIPELDAHVITGATLEYGILLGIIFMLSQKEPANVPSNA